MPKRGTPASAGLDLYMDSNIPKIIKGHETELLNTNLRVYIPDGCYGRIAPRSSLAKLGIIINAGVIDSDYRGEIKMMLHNLFHSPVYLHGDQPVAQLIIEKLHNFPNGHMLIHDTKILDSTERGEGGFGSTNSVHVPDANHIINDKYHSKFGLCRGPCPKGGHHMLADVERAIDQANEAKRAKKDPLVGIETNPGPQVTSCDSCGKVLDGNPPGYTNHVTLIGYGVPTVYFCNLQCMVDCLFQRKRVTSPKPMLEERKAE